jgi:hypothetical protein
MEDADHNLDNSYHGSDGETYRDDDKESNPFHDNHTLSSDEEAIYQYHT